MFERLRPYQRRRSDSWPVSAVERAGRRIQVARSRRLPRPGARSARPAPSQRFLTGWSSSALWRSRSRLRSTGAQGRSASSPGCIRLRSRLEKRRGGTTPRPAAVGRQVRGRRIPTHVRKMTSWTPDHLRVRTRVPKMTQIGPNRPLFRTSARDLVARVRPRSRCRTETHRSPRLDTETRT